MINHGLKSAKAIPFVSLTSCSKGEIDKPTRNKILGLKLAKFLSNTAVLAIFSIAMVSLSGGALLAVAGAGALVAAIIDTSIEYGIRKKYGKVKKSYKKKALD